MFQDEQVLAQKESDRAKTGSKFSSLKDAEAADAEAFAAAQKKYQAVSAGLLSSEDGTDATLQEQLMSLDIPFLLPPFKAQLVSFLILISVTLIRC